MPRPLDLILGKLPTYTQHGASYRACCPGHGGDNPTALHITPVDDTVLLYCHAQACKLDLILSGLGLTYQEVFGRGGTGHRPQGQPKAPQATVEDLTVTLAADELTALAYGPLAPRQAEPEAFGRYLALIEDAWDLFSAGESPEAGHAAVRVWLSVIHPDLQANAPLLVTALRRHASTNGSAAAHQSSAEPTRLRQLETTFQSMGERFVFYRFVHDDADEAMQADKALDLIGQESAMRQALSEAMASFFEELTIPTHAPALDHHDRERLIALASLAARCRSAVERDGRSREIELIPDAEAPGRLALTLARLFAGLKIIGVERQPAWALLQKVALDCMTDLRRKVFEHLMQHYDAKLSTPEIAAALGYPTITANRSLEDMAAHGIVIRHTASQGKSHRWNISDWALNLYRTATNGASSAG